MSEHSSIQLLNAIRDTSETINATADYLSTLACKMDDMGIMPRQSNALRAIVESLIGADDALRSAHGRSLTVDLQESEHMMGITLQLALKQAGMK